MSSELAVSIKDVTKCYRIYTKPEDRLKQMLFGRWKRYYREFWALREMNLEIKRGSTVGILGRNGAGKSTLLQIMCNTLAPTSGEVKVGGRIGALLELGTGFNPEFTGRENVFLNGSILGLSEAEIHERFDDIAAFADIGSFIDQPVKTYSSGMFIRLAFSVAINIDPDILIVDEALSVGDVQFQAKCFRKFEEFKRQNKTIIFVTHSPDQVVRHCDRAILIEGGKVKEDGRPKDVVNKYLDLLFGASPIQAKNEIEEIVDEAHPSHESFKGNVVASENAVVREFIATEPAGDGLALRPGFNRNEYRWGDRSAEIVDALLATQERTNLNNFAADEKLTVYMKVKFNRNVAKPIYALTIKTPDGITIYGTNSRDWDGRALFVPKKSGEIVTVRFSVVPHLMTGHYLLSFGVVDQVDSEVVPLDRRYDVLEVYVTNVTKSFGLADLRMDFAMVG